MTKTLLELVLPVSGMSCASCVSHVEGALKELEGIANVVVNLATNKTNLSYDPQLVKIDDMRRVVEDVGYAITAAELTLDVQGMTCASCVSHVEGALNELDGVTAATVNLGLGTAKVTYIPGVVSVSAMKKAVQDVGYEAKERGEGADALVVRLKSNLT
jgi:P-type Cu+ transporter